MLSYIVNNLADLNPARVVKTRNAIVCFFAQGKPRAFRTVSMNGGAPFHVEIHASRGLLASVERRNK